MRSPALARKIAQLALTKKAHDVVTMDLRKLTTMADYFVICSADSDIQVKAIADAVEEGVEKAGLRVWHREAGSANWMLLDYVDVVCHVFHKHTRSYYNLEKLWGDAEIKRLDEKPAPRKRSAAASVRAKRKPAARRATVRP